MTANDWNRWRKTMVYSDFKWDFLRKKTLMTTISLFSLQLKLVVAISARTFTDKFPWSPRSITLTSFYCYTNVIIIFAAICCARWVVSPLLCASQLPVATASLVFISERTALYFCADKISKFNTVSCYRCLTFCLSYAFTNVSSCNSGRGAIRVVLLAVASSFPVWLPQFIMLQHPSYVNMLCSCSSLHGLHTCEQTWFEIKLDGRDLWSMQHSRGCMNGAVPHFFTLSTLTR